MPGIFVYADTVEACASLISAAYGSARGVCALTFDEKRADELGGYGADNVFLLKGDNPMQESYAKAIAALLAKEGPEVFLVGSSTTGREIAAKVAMYLDCGLVGDISSLAFEGGKTITTRYIYGGAAIQTEVLDGYAVVTVPKGKFEARKYEGKTSDVITLKVESDNRVTLKETIPLEKDSKDLGAANIVVCIGMGFDKKEDMKIAEDLGRVLGATIGCTRGIVEERHWLPAGSYIGISGTTVKPSMYISLGVSGQIQHVVGIRDSKIIVAVNSNANAPIFMAADYGIVGDMYEIIPLLTEAIRDVKV
jgi:electron transfer flavoprotein alpha subunit